MWRDSRYGQLCTQQTAVAAFPRRQRTRSLSEPARHENLLTGEDIGAAGHAEGDPEGDDGRTYQ